MAKIIKVISILSACAFCIGMIICTNLAFQTGVYVCIAGCFASFLVSMLATARENRNIVEANLKQEQAKQE